MGEVLTRGAGVLAAAMIAAGMFAAGTTHRVLAQCSGPSIASVSPNSGPDSGGTAVTITGCGFLGASDVYIGNSKLFTAVTVNSDSSISATSPPNPAGTVDVRVFSSTNGNSPIVPGDQFTYNGVCSPSPQIVGMTAHSFDYTGGDVFAIEGCGFTGATAVNFGTTPARSFGVQDDSQINVISPEHTGATVDVTVTTPSGTSPITNADKFTFLMWSASIDTSTFPTTWAVNVPQTFNVTITNNGTEKWFAYPGDSFDLDLHFAPAAGGSAVAGSWTTSNAFTLIPCCNPAGPAILPGGSTTISVTVTPVVTGPQVLEGLMIWEHRFWFDQVTPSPQQWFPVSVYVKPDWSASIDTSTFPATWVQGVSQTFSVTVTNTGSMAWPSTGANEVDLDLHFASSPGGSANSANWLTSNAFSLPAGVPPGGSASISVTVTPNFFGHEYLEGLMIKEHEFWFDHVTSSPQQWADPLVLVSRASWNAAIDTSTFPTTWVKGVSQTFTVKVTNKGNVTWVHTGYNEVDLDLHFASYAGGSAKESYWLTSNAFALPNDVPPGQSVTVPVTLTPNFFGHEVLEGLMISEHQFWFDQVTSSPQQWAPVNVTVTAT